MSHDFHCGFLAHGLTGDIFRDGKEVIPTFNAAHHDNNRIDEPQKPKHTIIVRKMVTTAVPFSFSYPGVTSKNSFTTIAPNGWPLGASSRKGMPVSAYSYKP